MNAMLRLVPRSSSTARLAAALATLLASASLGAAEESVDLKPQWTVGQRVVQQTKTSQTQKIALGTTTTPVQQKTEQVQDYALTVERERPGGGHEIALEVLAFRMETKMGEQSVMKYDSKTTAASGDANPLAGIFKKLVGAKFKLFTKPDGEIEKVEGVRELLDSMAAGMPEMVAGMLKSMVSEDMAKQMSGYPSDLPKEPVSPGYEWPVKTDMSLGPMGTITISMKYKYTGMERRRDYDCAVLEHKGFISGKDGTASGPMSVSSVSGTTTGRTYYVPRIATAVESFSDQKMKMSVKVMGRDTNIELDQRVTTRMTEITGQAK